MTGQLHVLARHVFAVHSDPFPRQRGLSTAIDTVSVYLSAPVFPMNHLSRRTIAKQAVEPREPKIWLAETEKTGIVCRCRSLFSQPLVLEMDPRNLEKISLLSRVKRRFPMVIVGERERERESDGGGEGRNRTGTRRTSEYIRTSRDCTFHC